MLKAIEEFSTKAKKTLKIINRTEFDSQNLGVHIHSVKAMGEFSSKAKNTLKIINRTEFDS